MPSVISRVRKSSRHRLSRDISPGRIYSKMSYRRAGSRSFQETERARSEKVEILPGFPEHVTGRLVFLPQDNLNTDAIYGKDYTYRDDMTPEMMARSRHAELRSAACSTHSLRRCYREWLQLRNRIEP
jgi:hypothetical protein